MWFHRVHRGFVKDLEVEKGSFGAQDFRSLQGAGWGGAWDGVGNSQNLETLKKLLRHKKGAVPSEATPESLGKSF